MSEPAQETPAPAKRPFSRRAVLILLGIIAAGFVWGIIKIVTWDPNYVIHVFDADKIILKSDESVLLIGLDVPPDVEKQVGEPAVAFVNRCVLNRYVRIERGEKPKDAAGWILAYLFYTDDNGVERFLNEELLRHGYGRVALEFPNLKYRKVFEAAEAEAKKEKIGVWAPGYKFPG